MRPLATSLQAPPNHAAVSPPTLLAALLVIALAFTVLGTLSGATGWDGGWSVLRADNLIVWEIRLPRTLGAWCVGALLGLAGAIAQGMFRNPLADPYLLGSSSGAALAVAATMVLTETSIAGYAWIGRLGLTGAAFIGAAAAVCLTLALARGFVHTASLLLAGIVVAVVLGAVTSLLLLIHPDALRAMQSFLLGSTAFLSWQSTALTGAALLLTLLPGVALARGLDALSLGEDTARSLGLPLRTVHLGLLGLLSLATATAVAQAGVVGFVGLAAPHLVRQLTSATHRFLLPASALVGGVLLQAADIASRWVVRPAELPVGIFTAVFGGCYLVWLMWRRAREA